MGIKTGKSEGTKTGFMGEVRGIKKRGKIKESEIKESKVKEGQIGGRQIKREWLLPGGILLLAALARLVYLGTHPEGTYTDEAYGAYLAYGILTEGMDDAGYRFPIYFTAWGSGMNALYLYLGALFFRIFGVSLTVYRLPQAIFGILGVYALYRLSEELFDRETALLASLALAVNPWHIMMCRFGLESNLAPNLFLIALFFLIKGLKEKRKWLIPAAFCFGVSLYVYAVLWLFLPLFFVLCLLFCRRDLPEIKWVLWFGGILFLMALPLFLFLAVNLGILPEIRTAFFSVPELSGFRSGELSARNIGTGLGTLFTILVREQGDGRVLLSSEVTGSYYYFTTPLWILGLVCHVAFLGKNWKKSLNLPQRLSVVFPVWFLAAAAVSLVQASQTMIHINMIHIPVIFYGAYGIRCLDRLFRSHKVGIACTLFYLFSFGVFLKLYAEYPFPDFFGEKPYEAVLEAKELAGEEKTITIVGFDATYKYPNLLWRERFPVREYAENRVMDGDPYFANLLSYGQYRYIEDTGEEERGYPLDRDSVYVLKDYQVGEFRKQGFEVLRVNEEYAVAFMASGRSG